MKRALLFAALALTLLVVEPLPAQAHGTCSSNATVTHTSTTVTFSGSLGCSENHPAGYGITVTLNRRLPGGTWAIPPSGSYRIHKTCTAGGKTCATPAAFNTWNCRYDWRAWTTGYVINGHSIPSSSDIEYHTC